MKKFQRNDGFFKMTKNFLFNREKTKIKYKTILFNLRKNFKAQKIKRSDLKVDKV
jgi:hypothetical protein